jgi:hypothetical protein
MACALAVSSPAGAGPLLPAFRESGTCSRRATAAPHPRPDPAPIDSRAYRDHPSDLDNHRQAGDGNPASNPDPAGDGHHPEFDPDGQPHGGTFPHRHAGGSNGLTDADSARHTNLEPPHPDSGSHAEHRAQDGASTTPIPDSVNVAECWPCRPVLRRGRLRRPDEHQRSLLTIQESCTISN